MKLTKFNIQTSERGDDFKQNRFSTIITYRLPRHRKDREYVHTVPRSILDEIGPGELARRIYFVFIRSISGWK